VERFPPTTPTRISTRATESPMRMEMTLASRARPTHSVAILVVLGYKGHSRIASFVIGTTAQKVNAYSRASVLIVKETPPPRIVPLQ
jgi:nucleotide-binding universal stress UspA family protein